MVDPYAIVRRLTGHELISPKDARLLTEAVDGLIGEIGSKDARIAELEAEVERLTSDRDGWMKAAIEQQSKAKRCAEADKSDDAVAELFVAAWAEADKAMRKFPQPNYVISKVAEEAGEVVKAAIHCAEGRETPANVIAEIRQTMAMLLRLYVEGDQVHGLPPLKAAMEAGR